jgi:hypothetical protein
LDQKLPKPGIFFKQRLSFFAGFVIARCRFVSPKGIFKK